MSLYHLPVLLASRFLRIFLSFYYEPMRANNSYGVASLGPWGMVGRTYLGEHLALLHTILREKSLAIIYNGVSNRRF